MLIKNHNRTNQVEFRKLFHEFNKRGILQQKQLKIICIFECLIDLLDLLSIIIFKYKPFLLLNFFFFSIKKKIYKIYKYLLINLKLFNKF